uniref:uncharacterized protein LOC122605729 n=1 Tax=Erigeron canadensis TaxID=72917 RepID=UPI001CB892AB|nr:uncharacterized protein LOC122605729 [Erigeron canadensis]
MGAVDELDDVILENILGRLDAKSLLRCRCVSRDWNYVITDPYFINNSRARRMIFVVTDYDNLIHLVDDNDRPTHSMLQFHDSFDYYFKNFSSHIYVDEYSYLCNRVRVLGTLNGIVLLQIYGGIYAKHPPSCEGYLMLYNPFIDESLLLPLATPYRYCVLPRYWDSDCGWDHEDDFPHYTVYAFGFGYGRGTPDDWKIVRFREYNKRCRYNDCSGGVCEIFSLKTYTWSKPQEMNIKHIVFETTVGTFLNGFLYWIASRMDKLLVLDVEKIQVSEMHLPFQRSYRETQRCDRSHLGTINGCLCFLNRSINDTDFNLWVMKDQADENSWFKRCSFTLAKDVGRDPHHFVCILYNGRIVMENEGKLHIYDTSDDSYTSTDISVRTGERSLAINGIEYVETLVSLSAISSQQLLAS